eukprot:PhM_4_TR17471/c0_g1_i1/m.33041/K13431/SRPR; signal recognition particle receptor subunit alpha
MIDEFAVISLGGLVLWKKNFKPVEGNPINELIRNVVLEERVSEDATYMTRDYRVRFVLVNEFELIFVVIMQRMLQILCAEKLLNKVRDSFVDMHRSQLKSGEIKARPNVVSADFDEVFNQHYEAFKKEELARRRSANTAARTNSSKQSSTLDNDEDGESSNATKVQDNPEAAAEALSSKVPGPRVAGMPARRKGASAGNLTKSSSGGAPPALAKKPKVARNWAGGAESEPTGVAEVTGEDPDAPKGPRLAGTEHFIRTTASGEVAKTNLESWSDDDDDASGDKATAKRGKISTWLRNRFGDRELDDQDIDNVLPALREKLIAKNVAVHIADKLCESVKTSLQGRRLGTFEVLNDVIQAALIKSLQRILTPKREISILREAQRCRDDLGRPYIICFCGVNGVGKSTSLSKVAFLLKQNGFSVLLAACDTFRGGAVEQLEVHAAKIGIPLHAQGYDKDASAVATNAIARARREKIDVVLVDTAGRMQDHESRMQALAKLVHENKPDLTLFVGEALVGNDGADQLMKFNQCFIDLTPPGCPQRGIDGIFLTKFDTIDDKMGAAVSMVYQCGQPIVFVGVGQTYQDLKSLHPDVVVRALLS